MLCLLVLEGLSLCFVMEVLVVRHLGHHLADVAQVALGEGLSVVDELRIHIRQSVRVALALDEVVLTQRCLVLAVLTVVAVLQDDVARLVRCQTSSLRFLHVV